MTTQPDTSLSACCTVPTDRTSSPDETETPSTLDEIRAEEIPADVAAIRAAGFNLLLETGRPVTVDDLAATTDVPAERVAEILDSVSARGRVEFDDKGRLIGLAGLTLTPGRHKLTIDRAIRWTWCALDAVGIMGALEATGTVSSTDPQTGDTIEISFVEGRANSDSHLFILGGYRESNVRRDWCPQVNFFANRRTAVDWVAANDIGGDIVTVADITEDAAAMWRPVVDTNSPRVC